MAAVAFSSGPPGHKGHFPHLTGGEHVPGAQNPLPQHNGAQVLFRQSGEADSRQGSVPG